MTHDKRAVVFSHPDDPYTVTCRWEADGVHVVVSADILLGGDPTDVHAEAQRRADLLRDHMLAFLRPISRPEGLTGG